jgi:flagellar protein FliO/FliZ
VAGFAINPPFTMRMLDLALQGSKAPGDFNSLLVFAAANVTGVVNHWLAGGKPHRGDFMFSSIQVQVVLALVFVIGLVFLAGWGLRWFGTGRFGGAAIRGRQPRLAVLEHASVDARRRLILVRRDNVEHLVMIGGPTDVVVEGNIVRATAAPRDVSTARPTPTTETLPRALPLPDNAGNGSWPLQPEHGPTSAPRAARSEPSEEPAGWSSQPQGESPSRTQRDTLAALADELSTRQTAPPRGRPQASARPHPPEPRMPAAQPPAAEPEPAVDQSLADMAHRLEAALRKPNAKADRSDGRAAPMPRAPMPGEHSAPAESPPAPTPPSRAGRAADAKPPRADAKQPNPGKMLYDSLEQEMASLLGRPTSKN